MHTGTLKMPENSHKYTNPYTKELHLEHHRLFSRPDKCFYSFYFEYVYVLYKDVWTRNLESYQVCT